MIGTRVGPFAIVRLLGEAGIGRLYIAEHAVLGTRHTVKIVAPSLPRNAQIVRRLVNKGRAAVELHHRNLRLTQSLARERAAAGAGSRYQLGDQLGSGGMAEVFVGTMIGVEGFARRVAIKRVLSGLSQVSAFATMFVAEAQIASRLAHPNIVSVLDFSRDPEDRLFLVMEYVDGKDLASLLDAGPIPPSIALFIAVELLRGLGYAHDLPDPVSGLAGDPGAPRGVVHRDVSPQNVLISYEGCVKLSDFGLAKVRDANDGVWSETVRGKPSYMAPEQVAGELLDGRTDLYAVGVMLWEMLAQRPLFAGTTREILGQVMFRDVAAPSRFCSDVPGDLEAIAMQLLSRERDGRYATAEAAIDALLRCDAAPRDGRGDLAHLLAARFPPVAGSRLQRKAGTAATGAVRGARAEQITLAAPASVQSVPDVRSVSGAPGAWMSSSPTSPPGARGTPDASGSPGARLAVPGRRARRGSAGSLQSSDGGARPPVRAFMTARRWVVVAALVVAAVLAAVARVIARGVRAP